jgi:hypothetical protein
MRKVHRRLLRRVFRPVSRSSPDCESASSPGLIALVSSMAGGHAFVVVRASGRMVRRRDHHDHESTGKPTTVPSPLELARSIDRCISQSGIASAARV